METRKERFAKYREQIKRMPEDQFSAHKAKPSSADDPLAEQDEPAGFSDDLQDVRSDGPYSLYLGRRRRIFVIKIILLLLAVAGFVTWWFLLQGRKP